jgi:hypothetical protein
MVSGLAPGLEPSSQLKAVWEAETAAFEGEGMDSAVQAVVDTAGDPKVFRSFLDDV